MTAGAVTLVIVSVAATAFFFTHPFTPTYKTVSVLTRNLQETVAMNGTIVSAKNVDLSFDRSGRVSTVSVAVGQSVKAGQELVVLENTIESGQLAQAQASLDAKLAGTSSVDVAVYKAAVDAALADLNKTNADINTAKSGSFTSTAYAYQNANTVLHSVSAKLDDAISVVQSLFTKDRDYDQQYSSVLDQKKIADAQLGLETVIASRTTFTQLLQGQTDTNSHSTTDELLLSATKALADASTMLDRMNDVLMSDPMIADHTQSFVDTEKALVSAVRTGVSVQTNALVGAEQTIANAKIAQSAQTDAQGSAQGLIAIKQAAYDQAMAVLKSKQSPPRDVDVAPLRAAVEIAAGALQKTILRAPVDGVVARQDAKVGAIVSPGVGLVSVVNPNALQIEGSLSELDVVKVHVGDIASVTTDAYGTDTSFPATVVAVDQSATNAGYKVVVQFNGVDDRLKSGMQSAITIQTQSKSSVLAIPSQSITKQNGKLFVQLIGSDSVAHEREVQTGIVSVDGYTEITGGLQKNDTVVTFGN